jgi:GNAT superfamily N-acetyltransferase
LTLIPCDSDDRWARYEDLRVEVEAGLGLDEGRARSLVRHTRRRGEGLGPRLWLAAVPGDEVVGGIAAFPVTGGAARLQEVDVFPAHRGAGLGRPLLEALRRELHGCALRHLVVGADEDDWPLAWYRRLGFRQVARVARDRPHVR